MAEFHSGLFTYIGRRCIKSKLYVVIVPAADRLNESEERWYPEGRSSPFKVVGGDYECSFGNSEMTSIRLGDDHGPRYQGINATKEEQATWRIKDGVALTEKATTSRAKKDANHNALNELLLPLRRAYQETNARGKLAMEVELLTALRRKPTRGEER